MTAAEAPMSERTSAASIGSTTVSGTIRVASDGDATGDDEDDDDDDRGRGKHHDDDD